MLSATTSATLARLDSWLHRPILPTRVVKELRAVMPLAIVACGLPAVLLSVLGGSGSLLDEGLNLALAALYACFAALLGANVFGVEFSCRTVSLLLSQPVSRRRIWFGKMITLGSALALSAIAVLASTDCLGMFFQVNPPDQRTIFEQLMTEPVTIRAIFGVLIVAGAINGLCLGPWLSMLARSALAGAIFSVALPVVCWVGATSLFGGEPWVFFILGQIVCWSVGAVLGYRQFMRLEALDASSAEVPLPKWLSRQLVAPAFSAAEQKRWWVQLLLKELRLQQTSVLLAVVFCLGSVLLAGVNQSGLQASLRFVAPWYFVYSIAIPLLVGSLTCAEERQLATLEWHLTLPVRTETQWAIKSFVALTLSAILGAALPALLLRIPGFEVVQHDLEWHLFFGTSAILTVCGVYASSVCRSSVRAFALGLVLALAFSGLSWKAVGPTAFSLTLVLILWMAYFNFRRTDRQWSRWVAHAILGGMLILLLHVLVE